MDDLSAKLKKLFKPKPKGVWKGKGNVLGGGVTVCHLSKCYGLVKACFTALKLSLCSSRPPNSRDLPPELPQRRADQTNRGLKGLLRHRNLQFLSRLMGSLNAQSMQLPLNTQVPTRPFIASHRLSLPLNNI